MKFEYQNSIKSLVMKSQPLKVGVCDPVLEFSHGGGSHKQKDLLLCATSGPNHEGNFSNRNWNLLYWISQDVQKENQPQWA